MLWSSEPDREREAATCRESMVRKEMSKAISIPREKNLVTSKTRLKVMIQDLNRMCEEQLWLVEKLFLQTDVLQSAYEEALEREEQQASMKEWSEYRDGAGSPQKFETTEVDPNVRLPRLELPKFDGDVTRFHEFWDQFEMSVHR
ncbi:hypothetical protein T10_10420 [Trichinella papuae]|uniref:Uncharacterized protein n=1 Tax=Trichinella papuae TaxID=268474 RepID=A0A0V1MHB9_9BILA|nr:hypothetical protein T10_10420 [Trichinella papuae]